MRKILSAFFVFSIAALVIFYFWAKSPNIDDVSEYERLNMYNEFTSASSDTLIVMTYNVGYLSGMTNNQPVLRTQELFYENLHSALNLVQDIQPDIIGWQEIDVGSKRSFYYNQVDSIAQKGGYLNAFTSINWDKKYVPFPYWPIQTHFGKIVSSQSIFSKHPIVSHETKKLIQPINSPFYYNEFYLDRLAQIVKIAVGNQEIMVINVHLEAFDKETRQQQFNVIADLYGQYADVSPVLLMGDFNSNYDDQESGLVQLMNSDHIATSAINMHEEVSKQALTYSSENPGSKLDYIFYNTNFIQKVDSRVVVEAGQISDHLPVMMRFVLANKNAR